MHLESPYPRPSPCRVSRDCLDSTDLSASLLTTEADLAKLSSASVLTPLQELGVSKALR